MAFRKIIQCPRGAVARLCSDFGNFLWRSNNKKNEIYMSEICQTCLNSHNTVNGRFCRKMSVYVERREEPICEQGKQEII